MVSSLYLNFYVHIETNLFLMSTCIRIFKGLVMVSISQSSLLIHGDRTRPLFSCKTDRSGRDTLDSAIINTHRANKTVARSDVLNN